MTTLMIKDLSNTGHMDRRVMADVHGGIIGACAPSPKFEPGMTWGDYYAGLSQYLGNIGQQNGLNCDGSAGPHSA